MSFLFLSIGVLVTSVLSVTCELKQNFLLPVSLSSLALYFCPYHCLFSLAPAQTTQLAHPYTYLHAHKKITLPVSLIIFSGSSQTTHIASLCLSAQNKDQNPKFKVFRSGYDYSSLYSQYSQYYSSGYPYSMATGRYQV